MFSTVCSSFPHDDRPRVPNMQWSPYRRHMDTLVLTAFEQNAAAFYAQTGMHVLGASGFQSSVGLLQLQEEVVVDR